MIHKEIKNAYHQKKVTTATHRKTGKKTKKQSVSRSEIDVLSPAVRPLIKTNLKK
jgi:hypothetical protein